MTPIITKDGELASTSKENVKENGEVFTPTHIVSAMMDLIPTDFIADKSAVMIEPTCGTGNFLVQMYSISRSNGLTIQESLNRIIGMELNKNTIQIAKTRLYELVCKDMISMGIKQGSTEWFNMAIECVAIVHNNIFSVKDSLIVMDDYAKGKGELANKKFVFIDPTGNDQVMKQASRDKLIAKIKKEFRNHKDGKKTETLAPFFGEV